MSSISNSPPWSKRSHVSVAEAAIILCRSQTWVRNKIVSHALRAVRPHGNGPICVTTDSIMSIVKSTSSDAQRSNGYPPARRPELRLIVDNTK